MNVIAHLLIIYSFQMIVWILLESYCPWVAIVWMVRIWMMIILIVTYIEWKNWNVEFARRPTRGDVGCPSNGRRPGLISIDGGASCRFASLPSPLAGKLNKPEDGGMNELNHHWNEVMRPNKKATAEKFVLPNGDSFPSSPLAKQLSFDHLYLRFSDLLWLTWHATIPLLLGIAFGGPNTSGLFGIVKMKIVERLGRETKNSTELAEKKLVDLILGTTLVTWITVVTSDDHGNLIGQLLIPQATHVNPDATVTAGELRIIVNISKRTILEAFFMNKHLEFGDATALLFLAGAVQSHPVIHSYANWGINPSSSNEFLRKMACWTIYYNNLGMAWTPWFLGKLKRLRILKYTSNEVTSICLHQGPHTVPPHGHNLRLIANEVEFVDFIFKVRKFFLEEFLKYRDDFPGIDSEAMFISTVLHSVDHCQAPRLIGINDFRGSNDFQPTRELSTVILNCFTDEYPFTLFDCRFTHAPHPFYKSVYKFAASLNTELADSLECGIAK